MLKDVMKINELDNVVVAIRDMSKGYSVDIEGMSIELMQDIKEGHKIALKSINTGEMIYKYGYPIGHAIKDIRVGQHVHSHNIKTNLKGKLKYSYKPTLEYTTVYRDCKSFNGYVRENGDVGIRNELWIVPTVGCVNGIGQALVDMVRDEARDAGIDAVHIFKHNYGCSQLGGDHTNTVKILRDIVCHPNAGGVLVLGLGCENNQIHEFKNGMKGYDRSRVRFLVAQDVADEIEVGYSILQDLIKIMKTDAREKVDISKLKIGLKCGGSDGFSGITANPLLGRFSDYLVGCGGSTILTEVPEMFGAEQILMNRCIDESVFNNTVSMINDFKDYFISNNQEIYENPSPGNKKGGITTLEEKSLGCTQKSGSSQVIDVLGYGDRISREGLNLLYAPGNDLVASTALGASGCQLVLFTTGRGTPFGSFVPTVKISSNTGLYEKKKSWIDFNAGDLLNNQTMEELLGEFIDYLFDVINGDKQACNERIGASEIAIFKTGVTL